MTARVMAYHGSEKPVLFFSGTNLIGTVDGPPYTLVVSNLAAGQHWLTATYTDYHGNRGTSPAVRITLTPVNQPPTVSLVWPRSGDRWDHYFVACTFLKLKAEASDPDGSVAQVQFLADTNIIGTVTNPPFNLVWPLGMGAPPSPIGWTLRAVATDNLGAKAESTGVRITYSGVLVPTPVVEIVCPRNGMLFAAPATFVFSAEVLASEGDAGPVEFFVGTNSVGVNDQTGQLGLTATTPANSVTVSNLMEGDYNLTVRYLGLDGRRCISCYAITNTIRVVKLGVQNPSLTADSRLQFDVLTAFPGKQAVIKASPNLLDWRPISTNQPSSNTFTFTDRSPATNAQQFYRVLVPDE
jgi:hypothetical protein